jgi:hypothetical protein
VGKNEQKMVEKKPKMAQKCVQKGGKNSPTGKK